LTVLWPNISRRRAPQRCRESGPLHQASPVARDPRQVQVHSLLTFSCQHHVRGQSALQSLAATSQRHGGSGPLHQVRPATCDGRQKRKRLANWFTGDARRKGQNSHKKHTKASRGSISTRGSSTRKKCPKAGRGPIRTILLLR